MQAAGLLKGHKDQGHGKDRYKVKPHRAMAKPVLFASITQENSSTATIIEEASDGMSWITSHVQLPNGKSAWGGKHSERQKASEAHKRWVKVNKNKIGDASAGGAESQLMTNSDGRYRQTGVVNIVLYVGFGLITLGLIITFVGIGEHGFKSPELKLIGPSLIGCGVLFCLLRLFFCSVPACCQMCSKNKELDEKALLSPSRETLAEDTAVTATATVAQDIPQPFQHINEATEPEQPVEPSSANTIHSTIPNYIEDDIDDVDELGLNVEYIDEGSARQRLKSASAGGTRPTSSQSKKSAASNIPRIPDVHSNGSRTGSELVLNPATLEGAGD